MTNYLDYYGQLGTQNQGFGSYGSDLTKQALTSNTGLKGSSWLDSLTGAFGSGFDFLTKPFKGTAVTNKAGDVIGMNPGVGTSILQGLSSIGSLYLANQALEQQKDQFNFNKAGAINSYADQAKVYNTSVEDRYRALASTKTDLTPEQRSAYIQEQVDKNKLSGRLV